MEKNRIADRAYRHLASEIEKHVKTLRANEEMRIDVTSILLDRLKQIRQAAADLAKAVEIKEVALTFNSCSEEIRKMMMGISLLENQVSHIEDRCKSWLEDFIEWRNTHE